MGVGIITGVAISTNNRTDISMVVRKKEDLKEKIVDLLKNSENPLSTSDLAVEFDKAWHTVDRTCLMLQIDGKIQGFKVGKMNLWRVV
ncbi:MAG: hypothetical protein KKD18_05920 [Nanoarchaeota archaeon]|nr:hypothetical protein [Nanoarchaeota archaeon]MBU0977928.1 hypothetical protein [Nanoarchaeota archaeon]